MSGNAGNDGSFCILVDTGQHLRDEDNSINAEIAGWDKYSITREIFSSECWWSSGATTFSSGGSRVGIMLDLIGAANCMRESINHCV